MATVSSHIQKPPGNRLVEWLLRYRTSSRIALILKAATTILGAVLSLGWQRWLLEVMKDDLFGKWKTFQNLVSLGGVGDFGISGGMAIRVMHYLAGEQDEKCQRFLANARGVFLGISSAFLVAAVCFCPWLPGWLGMDESASSGSMQILFLTAGLGVALMLLGGYVQALNYIYGSVVWPIIPSFIFTQVGFAAQLFLAKMGAPLWEQYAVYITLSVISLILFWNLLRISHPWLGNIRPIRFDFGELRNLLSTSFWMYLISVGNYLYVNTDRVLIGKHFSFSTVTPYTNNYRLCELAITLIATASYVGIPAILKRLLSASPDDRTIGLSAVKRLQKFQIFAACLVAGCYLFFNEIFMRVWLGEKYIVSVGLQLAFGLNLAVIIGGDLGVQVLTRINDRGVRIVGLAVAGAALINLGLAFAAMHLGSITGIAISTAIAQSLSSLVISWFACPHLGISWKSWNLQSLVLPVLFMLAAGFVRNLIAPNSITHFLTLGLILTGFCLALAFSIRLGWSDLKDELNRIRPGRR